jgi:hypothetical protein
MLKPMKDNRSEGYKKKSLKNELNLNEQMALVWFLCPWSELTKIGTDNSLAAILISSLELTTQHGI